MIVRFFAGIALVLCSVSAFGQPVQIDVRSTGFEASSASRYVARYGSWMPIVVELTTEGSQARQVSLRCVTDDIDGDLVAYTETPIVLTPNAPPRRVWLYVRSGETRGNRYPVVEVHNMDGEPLVSSDPLAFDPVSSDYQMIVDISDRQLSALSFLDAGGDYYGPQPQREFNRNRCIARLQLENLPDRWYGLEAVDVLIWDSPQRLPDVAQQEALLKWVERGGQLILGMTGDWNLLRDSRLEALLPYEGDGDLIEVSDLPTLGAHIGTDADFKDSGTIPYMRLKTRRGSQVLFREQVENKPHDMIVTRGYGAGRVTACAISLRDLLSGQSGTGLRRTLPLLFDLTPISTKFRESESGLMSFTQTAYPIRNDIMFPTEFRSRASLLVLAAFIFVGAYVLISTWVSWGWLSSRKMTQASWVLFAACAVVASLFSVGAVQFIRGTSDAVHTFSLVDLEAGSSNARAEVWAGYRSGLARKVNMEFEGEDSFIRAAVGNVDDESYETPERYVVEATSGMVRDAPLRATLKQFQGHWEGTIEGSVRGQLVADPTTGKLLPESWVENNTDRIFDVGYLLYIDPRRRWLGEVQARPGSPNQLPAYWDNKQYPPAVNVLALEIVDLKPQGKVRDLGREVYDRYDKQREAYNLRPATNQKKNELPQLLSLWHMQNLVWANSFRTTAFGADRIDTNAAALMFYATQHLYLHNNKVGDFDQAGAQLSSNLLPRGDVTHWLQGGETGQAVLLLYSSQPASPRLVRDGTPLTATRGAALYRVRIPIRWSN